MVEYQLSIHNIEEIRRYVTQTLSQIELLRPESSHLTLRLLTRSGQPCGVYFCLHGPRAVRLTAIWETDANTILFYGSRGERVQRTKLLEAPKLEVQAITSWSSAA
jgi:hypothetical protein